MSDIIDYQIPISMIKQYVYCRRRFSLMMIDGEWGSNYKIVQGDLLHTIVDDPFFNEKRGDLFRSRSVPVYSDTLNLYGVCDMVEFTKSDFGVCIATQDGYWLPRPIEYKNGTHEKTGSDELQLLAQAICLEEMFDTRIQSGSIYYGKNKHRSEVAFTHELKEKLMDILCEMNHVLKTSELLTKSIDQNCSLCSLINICLPVIFETKKTIKQQIGTLVKERAIDA